MMKKLLQPMRINKLIKVKILEIVKILNWKEQED